MIEIERDHDLYYVTSRHENGNVVTLYNREDFTELLRKGIKMINDEIKEVLDKK